MNTAPNTPSLWPPDLFEVFTQHFYARGIIGGAKSFKSPNHSEWIVQGRFLLTKTSDQVLESLFWDDQQSISDLNFRQHLLQYKNWSSAAAAYLAGILKKKQFLPDILRLLPGSTSGWYGTAPYIALSLMLDSETEALIEACRTDETCREGAEIALDLIRRNQLIDHLGSNGAKQIPKRNCICTSAARRD